MLQENWISRRFGFLAILVLLAVPANAEETVLMRRDYQTHLDPGYPVAWPKSGAAQTTPRMFSGRGSSWDYVHRPSGCWNDTACIEWIWPAGKHQLDAGWYWRGALGTVTTTTLYIRFRVKHLTGNAGANNNKAFIWCLGGDCNGVSRLMLHFSNGDLSRVDCVKPGNPSNTVTSTIAENTGPDGDVGQGGWNCAGKNVAINQWWHVQHEIRFGSSPRARSWFNNNNFSSPDDTSADWTGPWSPTNFNEMMHDGAFFTDPPNHPVRWQMSHFEIAETFDPAWCLHGVSGVKCKGSPAAGARPAPGAVPLAVTAMAFLWALRRTTDGS